MVRALSKLGVGGRELSGLPRVQSNGLLTLRLSLAIVFFWFGGIKLWPASPAEPIVRNTIFFLPHPAFFWTLGAWEAIVGLLLLSKRTIRYAAWLLVFQMVGTQTTLAFFPEAAWTSWGIPSDLGVYVLKNWILVSGVLVVAVYYTGSEMPAPPRERLRSPTIQRAWSFVHRVVTEWLPRNGVIFLRVATSVMLVIFGVLTLFGHGEAMTQVGDGLAALGIQVADATVFDLMGTLKLVAGVTLLSDDLLDLSLVTFSVYLLLGLLPMFLLPEQAFFQGYVWLAPGFFTLYFLKDLVVFGAIYTVRDTSKGIATVGSYGAYWDPGGVVVVARDVLEVVRFWTGLGRTR